MTETNHRILLRARPTALPQPDNFVADSVPQRAPAADEVLLQTIFLSIDPAMRSWMSAAVPLGEVMRGGGIARVLESRSDSFQPGELVQARLGWQTHPTLPAEIPAKGRSVARRCAGLDRSTRPQRGNRLLRHARYRRSEAG